jgi:hypothetical protein
MGRRFAPETRRVLSPARSAPHHFCVSAPLSSLSNVGQAWSGSVWGSVSAGRGASFALLR